MGRGRGIRMITKDMIISDIITRYPATVSVFIRHGLDCYECQLAELETIEHGAHHHQLDINELLAELNASCH